MIVASPCLDRGQLNLPGDVRSTGLRAPSKKPYPLACLWVFRSRTAAAALRVAASAWGLIRRDALRFRCCWRVVVALRARRVAGGRRTGAAAADRRCDGSCPSWLFSVATGVLTGLRRSSLVTRWAEVAAAAVSAGRRRRGRGESRGRRRADMADSACVVGAGWLNPC